MSNKVLILVVVLIIIVGSSAAGYFYWEYTKPLIVSPSSLPSQQSSPLAQSSNTTSTTATDSNPSLAATATSTNPAGCVRDFSSTELAKNTNISIANREVAINVLNFGTIVLGFYNQDAPKAVANFLRLTDSGYYDCLTFHRVAAGFVIQGGDPNGNGSGGESAFGAPFADELNPNTPNYQKGYVTGTLAMANSGPNTNGSQFFITLADENSVLQHKYTIFGYVISGQDVVDAIGQLATNPPGDGMPTVPVIMSSVKIIK
jgi:cyclophilin family peptidyl-prolyl cis-trans isomerase